jgi:hypothetical protein
MSQTGTASGYEHARFFSESTREFDSGADDRVSSWEATSGGIAASAGDCPCGEKQQPVTAWLWCSANESPVAGT